MSSSSRVGTAIAAGYFLGRFKKLRLALVVGSALANKNLRTSGLGLLQQGTSGLTSSPEAKKLTEQITSQLLQAGKAAAVTAAAARIDKLSDSLNERSSELRELTALPAGEDEADEEPEDEYEDEGEEEEPEDEYDEDEEEPEEEEGEPEDEYEEEPEEEEEEEEPEPAPKARKRSPRRRRAASSAGRS